MKISHKLTRTVEQIRAFVRYNLSTRMVAQDEEEIFPTIRANYYI